MTGDVDTMCQNNKVFDFNDLIRDYRMMKKEVGRLQRIICGTAFPMISWGVAQYGIESTLPKGSSGKSHAELLIMDIREQKQYERMRSYERKIFAIESAGDFLDREILKIVYDCMLSGMTRKQIAIHLEISVDSLDKLRADVKLQIGSNTTFSELLHGGNPAC